MQTPLSLYFDFLKKTGSASFSFFFFKFACKIALASGLKFPGACVSSVYSGFFRLGLWLICPKEEPNLITFPPNHEDRHAAQRSAPRTDGDEVRHRDESTILDRESLPVVFREFSAALRDCLREGKKFIIFLRHQKNIAAALAFLTLGLVVATFVQSFLTGIQIAPLRTSAEAAKQAADIAQKQLELSERPWIKIINVQSYGDGNPLSGLSFEKIVTPGQPDREQATLATKLVFANIGHSVADVTPNLEFFMPQFNSSEYWNRVNGEEQRFCGSPDMSAVTAQKITLFPDEPQPFEYYSSLSAPIRQENITQVAQDKGIFPALIVCVSYRHKGLPKLYQTRAVYEVSNSETHQRLFAIGSCNMRPFKNMGPFTFCQGGVPAALLKFERDYNGDDAF
jgi:hypothetical protein